MVKNINKMVVCLLVLILYLVVTVPVIAEDTSQAVQIRADTDKTRVVQPEVDHDVDKKVTEKKKDLIQEAIQAVDETRKALAALDAENPNTKAAIEALERSTGKLGVILAREPELILAPIEVSIITHDLLVDINAIKALILDVENLLDDGEIQRARPLINSLISEIEIRTTNIPLGTYPDFTKEAAALIDSGKIEAAKAVLQNMLNMLVVTNDIIPLPPTRAKLMLDKAEQLAKKDKRTDEEAKELENLLKGAKDQLIMAKLLGYASQDVYADMYSEMKKIEKKVSQGKGGSGWFDRIKKLIKNAF